MTTGGSGGPAFPFAVTTAGGVAAHADADDELRGRILQVLFTAPGERVNLPEFGCGLLNLVFDASNLVLAAAIEFTVGQALTRWLGDELVVSGVEVEAHEEVLTVEVAYQRRLDLARRSIRFQTS